MQSPSLLDAQTIEANEIFIRQKAYFSSGNTRSFDFRHKQLSALEQMILLNEKLITDALFKDLRKPRQEAWSSEIGVTLEEIRLAKKNLGSWMKPQAARVPLLLMPARAKIYYEPLGLVLIIGPWNYPFQLALAPLIGAIAAGNCALIKPSELTPHTSKLLVRLLTETFPPEYISIVEGGVVETTALLQMKFDHIFFTGSTAVGKLIMQAAAKNLVPVTLELGGKSPVVVDVDADLELAARRIIWGKIFNAGQTCVSPDYLYVHESIAKKFLELLKRQIRLQLGPDEQKSESYARIVNQIHHQRLCRLIRPENVYFGGHSDVADLYIQPTILSGVTWDQPVMNEEIFGPLLPVLTFKELSEVISAINSRPKPLAAYFFSKSAQNQETFLSSTSFGGGCTNDVIVHLSNPHLPFGGVGDSGLGSYHGHTSFLRFSHTKSVLKRSGFFDLNARYAPYDEKKFKFVKRFFGVK